MKRALLLTVLWLGGCDPLTAVLVRVYNQDLTVPTDVQRVRIEVTNPEVGMSSPFGQTVQLCETAATDGCATFPLSLVLYPGSRRSDAVVRLAIDALGAAPAPVLSQAAVFTFSSGYSQHLDFTLYRSCLTKTCADLDQACDATGACASIDPLPPAPSAPAATITRVGDVADQDTANEAQVTFPGVEAGDLMLVSVAIRGDGVDPAAPPSGAWHLIAQLPRVNDRSVVFYRIADGTEMSTTNDPRFHFHGSDKTTVFQWYWLTTVYRGARLAQSKVATTVVTAPITFPSVTSTTPGAVLVGIAHADLGPGCQADGLSTFRSFPPVPLSTFDQPLTAGTPSGAHGLACSPPTVALYGIVLTP